MFTTKNQRRQCASGFQQRLDVLTMYKKRLEGIQLTDSWRELLDRARVKCEDGPDSRPEGETAFAASSWPSNDDSNNDIHEDDTTALAHSTLREFLQQQQQQQQQSQPPSTLLPIRVVLSLAVVLGPEPVRRVLERDDDAKTLLAFTPPEPTLSTEQASDERRRFRRRMERLALRSEEEKYGRLTKNLGMNVPQDDVTTRTMTYAASVGLNMIIAPLSFGCFMWFFSGPLLDYAWPMKLSPNGTDIRRVIIGVLSGCGMLFVEMLLFVIRTHELERAVRAKSRQSKNQAGPFGYYTSKTLKTFKEE